MSRAEWARRSIQGQVSALCDQEAGVRLGEDPECVHRMRVASRRLRASLRTFAEILPPQAAEIRTELRWLAGVLGEVRDLDVELAHLRDLADEVGETRPEQLEPLLGVFAAPRASARERVLVAVASHRYAALVAALQELAEQPWPPTVDQPAEAAAPRLVRRSYRRLRTAGDLVEVLGDRAPAEALHRMRIRAKELRYTVELTTDLYGEPATALVRRAARLQDVLGRLQDARRLEQRLRAASEPEGPAPIASLFLLGQLAMACAEQDRQARAAVPRAYQRLTGRPWRRLKKRLKKRLASRLREREPSVL